MMLSGEILIVGASSERSLELSGMLHRCGYSARHSLDCRRALSRLERSEIPVIICDRVLPDGDWKDLLDRVARMESPAVMIVTSHMVDNSLWAEVLNLGGHDVLAQPFEREEVNRAVSSAFRASSRQSQRTLTLAAQA